MRKKRRNELFSFGKGDSSNYFGHGYDDIFGKDATYEYMKMGYKPYQIEKAKKEYEEVCERMEKLHELERMKEELEHEKEIGIKSVSDIAEVICEQVNKWMTEKKYPFNNCEEQRIFVSNLTGKDRVVVNSTLNLLEENYDKAYLEKFDEEWRRSVIDCGEATIKYIIKAHEERSELFPMNECCVELGKRALRSLCNVNESKKKKVKIKSTMPDKRCMKYGLYHGQVFDSQKELAEYCHITKKQIILWKNSNYIEEVD